MLDKRKFFLCGKISRLKFFLICLSTGGKCLKEELMLAELKDNLFAFLSKPTAIKKKLELKKVSNLYVKEVEVDPCTF